MMVTEPGAVKANWN